MIRHHPLLAVLALSLAWAAPGTAQSGTSSKLVRIVSPVAGQEVLFRVDVTPPAEQRTERLELVAASGLVHAVTNGGRAGALEIRTPAEIRLAPTEAFRVTFSSGSPETRLHLVLPGGADQQVVAIGAELTLVRRTVGAPVELEAAEALEVRRLPVARR